MKQFSCGDVVPGCTATFQAETEDQLFAAVAEHARTGHGITEISPELVEMVRSKVREGSSS